MNVWGPFDVIEQPVSQPKNRDEPQPQPNTEVLGDDWRVATHTRLTSPDCAAPSGFG